MKIHPLVEWLPDENSRVFMAVVLKASRKGADRERDARKDLDEVLDVIHKSGLAVGPRSILDAVINLARAIGYTISIRRRKPAHETLSHPLVKQ